MDNVLGMLLGVVDLAVRVIWWLVLAHVVLSWLPINRWHPAVRFVNQLVEPMLRPFRAVLRVGAGGIDFSPLILLLVVTVVQRIVHELLLSLA